MEYSLKNVLRLLQLYGGQASDCDNASIESTAINCPVSLVVTISSTVSDMSAVLSEKVQEICTKEVWQTMVNSFYESPHVPFPF